MRGPSIGRLPDCSWLLLWTLTLNPIPLAQVRGEDTLLEPQGVLTGKVIGVSGEPIQGGEGHTASVHLA